MKEIITPHPETTSTAAWRQWGLEPKPCLIMQRPFFSEGRVLRGPNWDLQFSTGFLGLVELGPPGGNLMLGPQQDGFLISTFNFDTVGFNARIVFEGLVDDATVKCVKWFQFNHVTPAADLFGGFFGFLN